MPDEPDHTPEKRLGDLLPGESTKNISTLAIVNTVVATLNEVIAALRDEIVALGNSEHSSRKRIMMFMAVLMIAALASVVGMAMNYVQGDRVKTVVSYIQDCQKPDSACKKRNDDAIGKAVASISVSVFDSMSCVLLTRPEDRNDATVERCRDKYLGVKK